MKIYSVLDPEFRPYGRVLEGYDTAPLTAALEEKTPLPDGVEYVPSEAALELLPVMAQIRDNVYGGMPVQLGWCNGHNTKLNCLEYHRDSEINLGSRDFILLLAKEEEIRDGCLDTAAVRASWLKSTPLRCTTPRARRRGGRGSGSWWRCRWEPTRQSRFWSRKMRRTGGCGPGINGFWPIRRARKPHRGPGPGFAGPILTLQMKYKERTI